MLRFLFIIFVLFIAILQCESLSPQKCQQTPKEKHCVIEYRVRYRWAHKKRYVYNWSTKSCFEIRWANHCPPVSVPTLTNNFPTEKECLNECGGWA